MRNFFRSRFGVLGVASVLVIVVIILTQFGVARPIQNTVMRLASPVLELGTTIQHRFRNFFSYFRDSNALSKENQVLRAELERITAEREALERMLDELGILQSEKNFLEERGYTFIPARIIGRAPLPLADTLVINRGSENGVRVGQAIVAPGGTVIAKVSSTQPATATILPITNNQSEIAARVQNTAHSLGVVQGSHGISAQLTLIPQGETISSGEAIVTSGTEELIPPELLIGSVDAISYVEGELFQSATLSLPASVDDFSVISVVTL